MRLHFKSCLSLTQTDESNIARSVLPSKCTSQWASWVILRLRYKTLDDSEIILAWLRVAGIVIYPLKLWFCRIRNSELIRHNYKSIDSGGAFRWEAVSGRAQPCPSLRPNESNNAFIESTAQITKRLKRKTSDAKDRGWLDSRNAGGWTIPAPISSKFNASSQNKLSPLGPWKLHYNSLAPQETFLARTVRWHCHNPYN